MDKRANYKGKRNRQILTIPNVLSLFRICLIPVIVWLYCVERHTLWAGGVLLLSGATDIVDGLIARRFDMVSDLGKILDPLADKLTQGVVLLCLMFRFPLLQIPFLLLIAKELFMTVTGILVIRKTGNVFGAKWHGKAATCLLYGTMLIHVFWPRLPYSVSVISVTACTGMIAVSFALYGSRNVKALRANSR